MRTIGPYRTAYEVEQAHKRKEAIRERTARLAVCGLLPALGLLIFCLCTGGL
jgi:hypothetical protein